MTAPPGTDPLDPDDLAFRGVAGLADLLRRGVVTSRSLTELFLERIARAEPRLHAFTTVLDDSARAEAEAADRLRARLGAAAPPLLGLPIAVKDNLDVAGVPTRFGTGSPELPASFDAEIVSRLRSQGCVVLGKTTMPELALLTFGPARNAWDPARTSGGSSSGSATAVAAGLVPAATGTDGGGSIRLPAALSGLVGLKPTPGLVPLGPDVERWCGLSAAGFLTRSVRDTALMLDAVLPATSPSFQESLSFPTALRIGLAREAAWTPRPAPLDEQVVAALDDTASSLAEAGHAVRPVDLDLGSIAAAFTPLVLRGARDDLARLVEPRAVGPTARLAARLGRVVGERQVAAARRRGERLRERMLRVFDDIDVLLLPTVTAPADAFDRFAGVGALPTLLASSEQVTFTAPWNVVGFPAMSVPAGWSTDGLPLAVQLVGRPDSERPLLALAAQLEQRQPWEGRRPDIPAVMGS